MNKRFLTLLVGSFAALTLASCKPVGNYSDVDFKGAGYKDSDYFALTHVVENISVGQKKSLSFDSFPAKFAENSLEFSSANENVVKVDDKGVITGVGLGISDVTVKAKDDSFEQKARVVVSEKTGKTAPETAYNNIKGIYIDPSYKAPRKVVRYEYSEEFYSCEGVRDHGMASYEVMGFDADTGYFFVDGPSVTYRTQKGAPEVMNGKWVFYPVNYGMMTRILHITPTGKAYYDFNTSAYLGNFEKIIKHIMNFFFVSGEKIVNDLMKMFDGKKDFNDFTSYSATSFYKVNNNALMFDYVENGDNQVIDADDELNYMDIPTGTVYSYDFTESMLNSEARCRAVEIAVKYHYELDGKKWEREFNRSQIFDNDFEEIKVQNPKDNGYQEVYSLYDL